MAEYPERRAYWITGQQRSDASVCAQWTGPCGIHEGGCAVPSVFHRASGAGGDGRAAEPGESVRGFTDGERLRKSWRAGFRRHVRRDSDEGAERGVVAEVVCAFATEAGSDGRTRTPVEERAGAIHGCDAEQDDSRFEWVAAKLQQIWKLA